MLSLNTLGHCLGFRLEPVCLTPSLHPCQDILLCCTGRQKGNKKNVRVSHATLHLQNWALWFENTDRVEQVAQLPAETLARTKALEYVDRNLDPSVTHSILGGATSSYEGLVYAPSTTLLFTGNTGGASVSWSAFIANKIDSEGNGDLTVDYEPGGSSVPLPVGLGNSKLVQ